MVWNRRRNIRKGRRVGKVNPPSEWVWSSIPRHEPLVTRELFDAASPVARHRQGSRTTAGPNTHPQTKRSYRYRSYVSCDQCDRRMFGKSRRARVYYACQPDPAQHAGRDWYPSHAKSIWLAESILDDAVAEFFATRLFGPHRRALLQGDAQSRFPRSGAA